MYIVGAIVGIVLLMIIGSLLHLSMSVLRKLLVNGITGAILLLVFNFVGGLFNLTIPITFLNALVAGFFGIPGVILLLILNH
ncbi:MAG: pro-sigmaK processing inhibitor BofA family protein [Tissierellia bacterium]|nr:pro-sigmaK processing inhibitor BofA family protein [Tissierellia bacterium]